MSEAHQTLANVVADRANYTTDPVRNLRTGVVFYAEIEPVSPIDLEMVFGSKDGRQMVVFHVSSDVQAAGIKETDQCQFTQYGKTVIYKIVDRQNNDANPMTDFPAVQVVTEKDR